MIITNGSPGDESPGKIFQEIILGFDKINAKNFIKIDDRSFAIKKGLEKSDEFQIILISGKGHESFQFFENGRKEKFNDLETVKKIIADLE